MILDPLIVRLEDLAGRVADGGKIGKTELVDLLMQAAGRLRRIELGTASEKDHLRAVERRLIDRYGCLPEQKNQRRFRRLLRDWPRPTKA